MQTRAVLVAAALLTSEFAGPRSYAGDDGVPIPGDDFVVTGDVKIRPGMYRFADANGDGVIHVKGDGTRLDLTGVTIAGARDGAPPDSFAGVGVSVDGAKDVTITGGAIRGFKIGVRVHDSPAAKIVGIDASGNFRQHLRSTVEREDESDWLFGQENDEGHWERDYGAGIALRNSPGATVERCVVRGGQNGVLLDRCDKAQVFDGDFSFNSGWGIALWRTCDATICRNSADFCVRGYSHGKYARGQDSAGILVFEQCSRNTFALNSATHGGDGFFLYAGNETLKRTGEGGCNDNVVWKNDFSHAVANGIEATFSRGNTFQDNVVDDCEHGVWAGYSWETAIRGNSFRSCANGVSIEHGHNNVIESNQFTHCGVGVHLWADDNADLASSAFGSKHDTSSRRSLIELNGLDGNRTDLRLSRDSESNVISNYFRGDLVVELLDGAKCKGLDLKPYEGHNPSDPPPPDWHVDSLPGHADAAFPKTAVRGRKYILVDDWGPVPPTETRLYPATIDAVGAAKLSALGVDAKFKVESLTDGFVVDALSGDLPETIVVRRKVAGFAPKAFEITVTVGGVRRSARGTIASMPWNVSFFNWTSDPRTDANGWRTLLAGDPVEMRHVDGLDFDWKNGAVSEKVGADRFGTLATCDVDTTAGKWRLSTVSDDGIRVWVDARLVVEDWTQHGPTPHDVDLDLDAGPHRIRVEHFEIDGWAALRVGLAPAPK